MKILDDRNEFFFARFQSFQPFWLLWANCYTRLVGKYPGTCARGSHNQFKTLLESHYNFDSHTFLGKNCFSTVSYWAFKILVPTWYQVKILWYYDISPFYWSEQKNTICICTVSTEFEFALSLHKSYKEIMWLFLGSYVTYLSYFIYFSQYI